jgi:hypothetical protein
MFRMRCLLIILCVSILCVSSLGDAAAWGDEKAPLAIHMISGSKEYKSEESLKLLQRHLETHYDVNVSASWVNDGAKDLPDYRRIAQAELLIVFARRMKLPKSSPAVLPMSQCNGTATNSATTPVVLVKPI